MRTLVSELDLSVRGATLINLHGRETEEGWSPFGSCYGSTLEGWTPEVGKAAKELREETECVVLKAKRKELVAFLQAHGKLQTQAKTSILRAMVMNVITEKRYPNKFVNAAPNVYVCKCGYEGPRTMTKHPQMGPVVTCPGCGSVGFLMQLKARMTA